MVTANIESTVLNDKLGSLSDALEGTGQMGDAAQMIANEARLFCKQVIGLTAPKTKEQGANAVKRDLMKIFTPVNEDFLNTIGSAHGVSAVDAWMTTADGEKKHLIWDRIDPSGSGMKNWHESNRNRRGRTRDLKKSGANNWYAPYVVSFEDFSDYLTEIQSHVGRKKAAWGVSFVKLGGKLASWINDHLPEAKGQVDDNLRTGGKHPSVTMSSFAPGVQNDERVIRAALQIRLRSIKQKAELILKGYSYDWKTGKVIKPQEKALALDAA